MGGHRCRMGNSAQANCEPIQSSASGLPREMERDLASCESCSAPSELFLCSACVTEFRAALLSLAQGPIVAGRPTAGLLDALDDVVTRQTCLGGGGGHRKRGDEIRAPFEPDTADNKSTRQGQASTLLHAARNTLSTIVRDVCETRGVPVPRLDVAACASWCAQHVHSLACDESAGQWKRDVDGLVKRIEKVIDRPTPPRFCGPCIHYVEHDRHCGRLLYARRDAIEITCKACHTTHNIERLSINLENRIGVMRFTSAEVLLIMESYFDSRIPERTWRRWRKEGRVRVRGYKRPDNPNGTRGAMGLHRRSDADEPLYRLAEVRKVYDTAIRTRSKQ